MERLPDNLIKYEILMRLPAKMVVRFRGTCKRYYRSTESDSFFVVAHCERGGTGDQKLFIDCGPPWSMDCNSLRKKRIRFPRMDDREGNDDVEVRIRGRRHGMLCLLFGGRTLVLWNPTTREFKRLTVPLVKSGDRSQIFRIGYDPYGHDYKLVVIDGSFYDEKRLLYQIPEKDSVYSWRHNSVQNNIIPQELYFIPTTEIAVYLNHRFHWYDKIRDDRST